MRDVYHQSVDNPIQLDRLPTSRPEICMLGAPASPGALRDLLTAFYLLCASAVIIVYMFIGPAGLSWFEPLDIVAAVPTIVFSVVIWIWTNNLKWLFTLPCLASIGLLAVSRKMDWGTEVLVTSSVIALYIYAYGRHWTQASVSSPVSRLAANQFNQDWHPQLILLSTVTAIMCAGLLWFESLFFSVGIFALPFTILFVPKPKGLKASRRMIVWESLRSWLSYDVGGQPGLFVSSIGTPIQRQGLTFLVVCLTAIALSRSPSMPVQGWIKYNGHQNSVSTQILRSDGAGQFAVLRNGGFRVAFALLTALTVPLCLPSVLAVAVNFPAFLEATALRQISSSGEAVSPVLQDLSRSSDSIERQSLFMGRVVADGSPVLVPRSIFQEHAHAVGDSGSGKTSLFLCPVIEQLARSGACSLIVIDLKGDSTELLASMKSAAIHARKQHGVHMPLKYFSNQSDKSTHAFNPLSQPFWNNLDLFTRSDVLCAALGLSYGTDYGKGFYSSANAAILHHTLKTFPNISNFAELADCIGEVMVSAKKRELHPEIRKAGVHVHEVMKGLATCAPLNVTSSDAHDPIVARKAIKLQKCFQQPQLMYFHLPATTAPGAAPEIARLATYMLLAAAMKTERKVPVFLVIDEFQRMVASNLEYVLQLARSLGVGVIIANQSLEDLRKSDQNLIPAVEANCRLRQWFGTSCREDQERLIASGGVTVDYSNARTETSNFNGEFSVSHTTREQVVDRITINDVLLTTDHPKRSFLRISRGAGYAQYGGMPVIVETDFHISATEYQRRRKMRWPDSMGTFIASNQKQDSSSENGRKRGPRWTTEIVGEGDTSKSPLIDPAKAIEDLFKRFNPMKEGQNANSEDEGSRS